MRTLYVWSAGWFLLQQQKVEWWDESQAVFASPSDTDNLTYLLEHFIGNKGGGRGKNLTGVLLI